MHKPIIKNGLLTGFILLMLMFSTESIVQSEQVTAEDKALTFLSEVLNLDLSKYTAKLSIYTIDYPSTTDGFQREHVKYTLQASDSTATAMCIFTNGFLEYCSVNTVSGRILYAKSYENDAALAEQILENHQKSTGAGQIGKMIALLEGAGDKNETKTANGIKMKVTVHEDISNDWFSTVFDWKQTINGADYRGIEINVEKSMIIFNDCFSVNKIGDATVNVSEEQAIDIALNFVETYTVEGIVGSAENETKVIIGGFNINQERTQATLSTNTKEPLTWYPCWQITLLLDQNQPYANYNYPSGIYGLYVKIWAGSGEVIDCTPLSVGGFSPEETIDQTQQPSSTQTQDGNTEQPIIDLGILVAVAVLLIISGSVLTVIYYKKKLNS